jgi:aminopeptidase N
MSFHAMLCCLAAATTVAITAGAAPLQRNFAVEHYDVSIQPDLAKKSLTGEVSIRFHSRIDRLSALELDAGAMEITSVSGNGGAQYTERRGAVLVVVLGKTLNEGEQSTITIRYRAPAGKGLAFFPDQVYGFFLTSDWLPCSDRPDDPATLRLRISADPHWKVAASGNLQGTTTENGHSVTEWKIDTPTPTYLFGFAAGEFAESVTQHNKTALRILAPAGMAMAPVADATGAAMQFFADRTGVAYPLASYTQVFAPGDAQQEAVGMALLPASYGEKLAKQTDDLWPLANQLAHQWYGVGIMCADWSDFWLSAGLSTFMADAFLEKRFGKARYEKEIAHSRAIFESWQADGKDRPLSLGDWQTPQQAMGELPYHKGAVVLDQLRHLLTDDVFWRSLHRYTSQYWGKRVTTDNLESAMDAGSGKTKSLTKFFERWVTGCCANLPPRDKR